ncbi:DNA-binding transcriptional regulator, MerR family [Nocardiopsis flavescens]|uniref:DNA-binding transcriptional regulator, MerR family n=1 Tax=Nocardiopsis flavescens TaxID=758803 RepID=A0A1M6NMX3_9ACTN|nr:MerR family transcriptional regulator [Nocardiopsis flavescens]SHJ97008.1 DNA-binding transcriptional regulator, MerR family [Nocardiopsis flavescens]
MFTIGEFASIGRVSVRMLRHYDRIGLLAPARVDPDTGYRFYEVGQLTRLSRIVQLRGFGLGLEDIARIVCGDPDPAREREILEAAGAGLRREIAESRARLSRIEAYLRRREGVPVMSTSDTIAAELRRVEPQRIAVLIRPAPGAGPENVGPVIGPMFPEAAGLLAAAGVGDHGPAIAFYTYDESPGADGDPADPSCGDGLTVTAGFVVPSRVREVPGLEVSDLPGGEAAVTTHRGEVSGIGETWAALVDRVREQGMELAGVCREVYWTPGDRPQQEWVTDLVQPVRRVS